MDDCACSRNNNEICSMSSGIKEQTQMKQNTEDKVMCLDCE